MANTALVVADASASAIISASGFNREQVELVKNTVAIGATDMELALFLQTAKHRGLDVFARQIHFVKRRQKRNGEWVEVGTMQTGIDGFRLIADRTGKYDGQDEVEYEYADPTRRSIPHRATVRVYRKDMTRPVSGTAYWAEYADTFEDGNPRGMWKKMPHLMLAKTAEALALRKAFPENLSGLYTEDEMPAIDVEPTQIRDGGNVQPTGTVTRMADRAQGEAQQQQPAAVADEIPPVDSDGATLRAWLGKRLAFRTKSWTGAHMATACAEVASALGLAEDAVTPRTLGEHLPRYRDAIAALGGGTPAETHVDEAAIVDETPAPLAQQTVIRDRIIGMLAESGIPNDDLMLQGLCEEATRDSDDGVRYEWEKLSDAELERLAPRLGDMINALNNEIPL